MQTQVRLRTEGNTNVVKYAVRKFLENKNNKCVDVSGIAPNHFIECLEACGIDVDRDSTDINGWVCDYWIKAKYEGEELYIQGSAWYGDASISREE